MARALGLPRHNIPAACERVLASLADGGRLIDAGRVTSGGVTRWFAGVVSAGFDAAVNELSRPGLLAVFPKVFSGTHTGHPAVHSGASAASNRPLTIDVVPGAVRVLA
jgi:diacylglycerol kinase family enzyme